MEGTGTREEIEEKKKSVKQRYADRGEVELTLCCDKVNLDCSSTGLLIVSIRTRCCAGFGSL